MKNYKNLPPDELPDPKYDALLEKLGLIHLSDALQFDGEIILLRDQTFMELKKDLMSNIDKITNKPKEEIEGIIESIVYEHVRRFDDRSKAILRDYSHKKRTPKKKNNL